MKTSDFDYELPPALIAQVPAAVRDSSRLLVIDRRTGGRADGVRHLAFSDFPSLIQSGDVVVLNDSRVIPARLLPRRKGGGAAEVLLLTHEKDGAWRALVKPGARIRAGDTLTLGGDDAVEIVDRLESGERRVRLVGPGGDEAVLARRGHVPLPPYIARPDTMEDRERYQTVYADPLGSVAAPTAGLHFTTALLAALEAKGVNVVRLTLHVGLGTFRPVTVEDPARHPMDAEPYVVSEEAARAVASAKERGGRVWAVGTTTTRVLESAAAENGSVRAGPGSTSLFIRPGYTFRVVDRLLTNFHLPRSTLLMLVCAFAGTERALDAYREAVLRGYRFYSYGDAMAVL
ncbi:MAG: tRNA preQ1(34) S-adenosylmethionine ribosyltransferase-isomerase QueA [Gemmatimonadales bacterium]